VEESSYWMPLLPWQSWNFFPVCTLHVAAIKNEDKTLSTTTRFVQNINVFRNILITWLEGTEYSSYIDAKKNFRFRYHKYLLVEYFAPPHPPPPAITDSFAVPKMINVVLWSQMILQPTITV